MIRVLYMSDLHLEMERWRLGVPGWSAFMARHQAVKRHPARGPLLDQAGRVDLVVLAGDIHNGLRGVIYADQVSQYLEAPVVMVAGNHEFYQHDIGALLPALRAATEKTAGRVSFLENSRVSFTIDGRALNVLGCTLWTDYALHDTPMASMAAAARRMNDHAFITLNGARFLPADALARHEHSRVWLHKTLAALRVQQGDASTLIVSHHAPDAAFLGARTGDVAPAYASDLLTEFAPWQPFVWVHGHTHFRHATDAGGVRVVSAPRGYVVYDGAEALAFQPGIVDV